MDAVCDGGLVLLWSLMQNLEISALRRLFMYPFIA